MKEYYVYILSSETGVLYIGMTNDLIRRVFAHKNHLVKGFTQKYRVEKLVYFESTGNVNSAIGREKQLKGLLRKKKLELITSQNSLMKDLYYDLL